MPARVKPTREEKLDMAVRIARQYVEMGEWVTLAELSRRVKTDTRNIRRRLIAENLAHVLEPR